MSSKPVQQQAPMSAPQEQVATPAMAAAARQLGLHTHEKKMMKLVDDMLKEESLPSRWNAAYDKQNDRWVYTDRQTGESRLEHPLIEYYRGAVFMDKGGYRQLLRNMDKHKPPYEEIMSECAYFGIEESEDVYIQEVAELKLCCPLPSGWEQFTDTEGEVRYRSSVHGLVLQEHPLDPYFRELRDRRRRELHRRRWAAVKAMQAAMDLHRKSMFQVPKAMPRPSKSPKEQQQEGQEGQVTGSIDDEPAFEDGHKAAEDAGVQQEQASAQDDLSTGASPPEPHPLMEELMQEWLGIHKSAHNLAQAVHSMASTIIQPSPGVDTPHRAGGSPGASTTAPPTPQPVAQSLSNLVASASASPGAGEGPAVLAGALHGAAAQTSKPLISEPSLAGGISGTHNSASGTVSEPSALQTHNPSPSSTATGQQDDRPSGLLSRAARQTLETVWLHTHTADDAYPGAVPDMSRSPAGLVLNSAVSSKVEAARKVLQLINPENLLHPNNFRVPAGGAASQTTFEPSGSDAEEALFARARASLQAVRNTLENAVALTSGLPADTPAVLATLPKDWLQLVPMLPDQWHTILLQLPADWLEILASLPPNWLQTHRALSKDWTTRLAYDKWEELMAWLPPDWPDILAQLPSDCRDRLSMVSEKPQILPSLPADGSDTLQLLPPDFGAIIRQLPPNWATLMHVSEWPQLIGASLAARAVTAGSLNQADRQLPKEWLDMVRTLPVDWMQLVQRLPPDWAQLLSSLPDGWMAGVRVCEREAALVSGAVPPADWPQVLSNLPRGWMNAIHGLPAGWVDVFATLPPGWLDCLAQLPPGWLEASTTLLPPGFLTLVSRLPADWAHKLHVEDWPTLLQDLPQDWPAIIRSAGLSRAAPNSLAATTQTDPDATMYLTQDMQPAVAALPPDLQALINQLPEGWQDILKQVPQDWPAILKFTSWPELLLKLPPDWDTQLAKLKHLPDDWEAQLATLRRLPSDWEIQLFKLQQLPFGWEQQFARFRQLPDDVEEQLEMLKRLPPDWELQLAKTHRLPADWEAQLAVLKQLPSDWEAQLAQLKQLPADWEAQLAVLNQLPAGWEAQLAVLKQLPSDWEAQLAQLKQLPAGWEAQLAVLKQLPAGWEAQFAVLKQLPSDWEAQLAVLKQLPAGWEAQLAQLKQLPAGWEAQLTRLRQLPQDVEAQLARLTQLPPGWESIIAKLPSGWVEVFSQVPSSWHHTLHFRDWPQLLAQPHSLPADWPAMLRTLPASWMSIAKRLPANWVDILLAQLDSPQVPLQVPQLVLPALALPSLTSEPPMLALPSIDTAAKLPSRSTRNASNPLTAPLRGATRENRTNSRPAPQAAFDSRPVPPEVKKRVESLIDKDLKRGRSDMWHEAPDERLAATWAESEVANLKQRLVRAEAARNELSAAHTAEIKATTNQLKTEKAMRQDFELKCQAQAIEIMGLKSQYMQLREQQAQQNMQAERYTAELSSLRTVIDDLHRRLEHSGGQPTADALSAEMYTLRTELSKAREQLIRVSAAAMGNKVRTGSVSKAPPRSSLMDSQDGAWLSTGTTRAAPQQQASLMKAPHELPLGLAQFQGNQPHQMVNLGDNGSSRVSLYSFSKRLEQEKTEISRVTAVIHSSSGQVRPSGLMRDVLGPGAGHKAMQPLPPMAPALSIAGYPQNMSFTLSAVKDVAYGAGRTFDANINSVWASRATAEASLATKQARTLSKGGQAGGARGYNA